MKTIIFVLFLVLMIMMDMWVGYALVTQIVQDIRFRKTMARFEKSLDIFEQNNIEQENKQ